MTTAFDRIVTMLSGDATLTAILTGGVYNGVTTPEISRQNTPSAYDANAELKPCGIVKPEAATPWGPHEHSGRIYVVVWLYERFGAANIESGRERIYTLLHRQKVTSATDVYLVEHANDLLGFEVQELGASAILSRFVATINRG